MIVKAKRSGLTVVEILVVVAIISLLVGMLLPAVSKVKSMAKEAKQKVQFTAIGIGLATFKNDYGDYPPSDHNSWLEEAVEIENSSGAQKLAEALLGWDLLGFHPDSGWRADGRNRWSYSVDGNTQAAGSYFLYDRTSDLDMEKRKGRYIDIDTANAVRLGISANYDGLFDLGTIGSPLASAAETFVLGDVFGKGKDVLLDGVRRKSGLPILYYRADASGKQTQDVYNHLDNDNLVFTKNEADNRLKGTSVSGGPWNPMAGAASVFYGGIRDPRASTMDFDVPYKPDSYILISAGIDGLYGTTDDITNFQR
jgi:type II secretory pathway pseudopilin PulG